MPPQEFARQPFEWVILSRRLTYGNIVQLISSITNILLWAELGPKHDQDHPAATDYDPPVTVKPIGRPMIAFEPVSTSIGIVAAMLTTTAFAPQAIKAWRSRSTGDVSLGMFVMLTIGIVLWLIYGVMIGDLPLILANAVTLVLAGAILIAKLRFR
jgi:MtN3 and saliva related transmembrane protein